jgi:hypothetical protein
MKVGGFEIKVVPITAPGGPFLPQWKAGVGHRAAAVWA